MRSLASRVARRRDKPWEKNERDPFRSAEGPRAACGAPEKCIPSSRIPSIIHRRNNLFDLLQITFTLSKSSGIFIRDFREIILSGLSLVPFFSINLSTNVPSLWWISTTEKSEFGNLAEA